LFVQSNREVETKRLESRLEGIAGDPGCGEADDYSFPISGRTPSMWK
jgi:hypothetical protein